MDERRVGVLGATSLVGEHLIAYLIKNCWRVTAFTRRVIVPKTVFQAQISWQSLAKLDYDKINVAQMPIPYWVCVAPIWVLPDYFDLLIALGARRIVCLSSTSRFTKNDSSDLQERQIAQKLVQSEELLRTWANSSAIEYIILRPTLIYGYGRDKNVTEMARFIRRFGFFPLLGTAKGLRQPIHVDDVVFACFAALDTLNLKNCSYNLAGGEVLPYRDMVIRIFEKLNRRPYLLTIPSWCFRFFMASIRWIPRYRYITPAMVERMNQDLQFDYSEAQRDLHFSPRQFRLTVEDLPGTN